MKKKLIISPDSELASVQMFVLSGGAIVNGPNRVAYVDNIGVNPNSPVPARKQQQEIIAQMLGNMAPGRYVKITVTNNHAANAQAFLMLDPVDVAAAKGASANGADIAYSSTFAGINGAAGYTALRKALAGGLKLGVVGTMFKFTNQAMIDTTGINIGNGNLENYNFTSIQNYLDMAQDTYANDEKILVVSTEFWVNQMFAITGTLPAQTSMTVLLNAAAVGNL